MMNSVKTAPQTIGNTDHLEHPLIEWREAPPKISRYASKTLFKLCMLCSPVLAIVGFFGIQHNDRPLETSRGPFDEVIPAPIPENRTITPSSKLIPVTTSPKPRPNTPSPKPRPVTTSPKTIPVTTSPKPTFVPIIQPSHGLDTEIEAMHAPIHQDNPPIRVEYKNKFYIELYLKDRQLFVSMRNLSKNDQNKMTLKRPILTEELLERPILTKELKQIKLQPDDKIKLVFEGKHPDSTKSIQQIFNDERLEQKYTLFSKIINNQRAGDLKIEDKQLIADLKQNLFVLDPDPGPKGENSRVVTVTQFGNVKNELIINSYHLDNSLHVTEFKSLQTQNLLDKRVFVGDENKYVKLRYVPRLPGHTTDKTIKAAINGTPLEVKSVNLDPLDPDGKLVIKFIGVHRNIKLVEPKP